MLHVPISRLLFALLNKNKIIIKIAMSHSLYVVLSDIKQEINCHTWTGTDLISLMKEL